jgi:predicted TIM-barrel fold metal-dependent hydrolase
MWATDFPWILEEPGYGKLTTVIEELLPDLSEAELADIMGGNAKRILRFPDL